MNLNIIFVRTKKDMEELLKKISEEFDAFKVDAGLQVEKSNKAAGTRARTGTLKLEKLLKEFRKASLADSKK